MDLETRVTNIENMLASVMNNISNNKFYTDADVAGVRKDVADVTPYTETKKGYYGERSKTFYDVPEGNVSVFFDDFMGTYTVRRVENRITLEFDPLTKETNITISIQ